MKCQLYQLHQIPGSLSFAWHSVVLLLGSWWKWWKYDIFPKRRTFFDDSNPVMFIHFPSISCPKKTALELTVEVKDETWALKNPTERSRNVQWTCNHVSTQPHKKKIKHHIHFTLAMACWRGTCFKLFWQPKHMSKKKTRHLWFVTSGMDQYLSISYILIQIRNPNLGRCTKVLTLDSESKKCSWRYDKKNKLSCLDLGPSLGPTCINL